MLVYTESGPGRQSDIGVLTLDGESKSQPFLQTPFNEGGGMVSPDGRFLAYASDEPGQYEVFVRPFPGPSGKWQISNEGGVQPVWARSGREIFYRNGDKMMAVPIETEPSFRAGKPSLLFERPLSNPDVPQGPYYDVTPDGEHFIMVQESVPTQIHVVLNWFEELEARVPMRSR
jgi:Tol biopolymer transport system component